jgi:hypothetical protein
VALMPKCVTAVARKGVVCRALRPPALDTELGLVYDPRNRSRLVHGFVSLTRERLRTSAGAP